MRNTKPARNRNKARGTANRSGRLNSSLLKSRTTRLRVEELEPRVVPSTPPWTLTDLPQAAAGIGTGSFSGGSPILTLPLKIDSNGHVVLSPDQMAWLKRFGGLPGFAQQVGLGTNQDKTPLSVQQLPNSHQDVGTFHVNPDGTLSPMEQGSARSTSVFAGGQGMGSLPAPNGQALPPGAGPLPGQPGLPSGFQGPALLGPHPAGSITLGAGFEGIDFNGSHCGCLPPDTNAGVGGSYVVETVNFDIRVFDKASGNILLDEPLSTLYGQSFGSDPYVVYDDIANHWYVAGIDGSLSGFLLATSIDSSPLDGFVTYHLTNGIGGFVPDYPKLGFNKDGVFITYNNFGSGGAAATVVAIDKNALLSGTLSYFVSAPPVFQFRAMPPAQMHGDTTGGVEWFVSTDGTDAGGNTIRVTELTNYLSNSPVYTLTSLSVAQYQQAFRADQPGGSVTTFPNTTTTQVQYRNGHLVTAMASATSADGFVYPKGLYYEVDVSSGTPVLLRQGVIDPGPGVAVQMPSVDENAGGNLGLTWMESSSTENLSMWVGSVDSAGKLTSVVAAPGGGFFPYSFRIGDYSTTVLDPTDHATFWSANEYIGSDGSSDIWRTHIQAFKTQLVVTGSNPAADSVIQTTPTDFTITWSDAIDPNSLNANDLKVDGIAANSVTVSADFLTTVFHYTVSPVTTEGLQTMDIPGGVILRLSDQTGNLPFHATFRYDPNPMTVTATNPAAGAVVNLSSPSTNLIVTFSETVDPTSVSPGNLTVSMGTVISAVLSADGLSVDYTISNLTSEGTENYSLAYGAVKDADGNPVVAYSSNFIVNILTSAYPVPLGGKAPPGSLIYDPSVTAGIQFVGDTDSFTVNLNAGQTITVDLKTDPSLQGQIDLLDPSGTNIGEVIASAAGAEAFLQTVSTTTAGTYTITISGANSTTGNFTSQLILNAALDTQEHGGASNGTLATAQNIDSSFINLGLGGASRGAVLGQIMGPTAAFGDVLTIDGGSTPGTGKVLLIDQTGKVINTYTSPAFANLFLFDVKIAPDNTFWVMGDLNFFTAELVHMDLAGNTLGTITSPVSDPGFYLSPEGFNLDPRDGSFWFGLVNSGNVVHLSSSGSLLNEYFVGGSPNDAAVGPDGRIYISQVFQNYIQVLDPSTGSTSFFASASFPIDVTWSVAGELWVGALFGGAERFSSSGVLLQTFDSSGAIASEPALSGNVWDTNIFTAKVNQFSSSGSLLTSTSFSPFQPGIAVYGDVPGEASFPPPQTTFYSFSLNAGESATIAAKGLGANSMYLLDGSGNVLAIGATGFNRVDQDIKSFVNTTGSSQTYDIEVVGNSGTSNYSLVVTKDADFDHGGDTKLNQAQSLDGTHTVLGALVKSGSLFTLDDQLGFLGNPQNPIWPTDPATAAFLPPEIFAPGSPLNNPFGENLAFDGTNLYYNDGAFSGDGKIYKIDPSTGQVLLTGSGPSSNFYAGIAYLNGKLYANVLFNSTIYIFDANTFALLGSIDTGLAAAWTGLAGDPDRGVLWAVSQSAFGNGTLYEIDPATGHILAQAADNNQGFFEQDIAYAAGQLIVAEAFAFQGPSFLDYYDPNTFAFIQRLPLATKGFVGGLGGDGLGGQDAHYYSINTSDGNNLTITDTAFNSSEAGNSGEFANALQPVLVLFDSNGNQVATASDNGTGTATLTYTVPTGAGGTYYVEATSQNKTLGEYTLDVEGATGAATPFTVVPPTTPASGSYLQSADHVTVSFSESVLVSSLSTADFTIDGNAATGMTVVNDHTVTFTFSPLPTGPEDQVTHNWVISGVQDLQGDTVQTVNGSFILDNVPPSIVSDTITEGQILTDGTSVQEVVTFSESMNTSLVNASSFQLQGSYRNASYSPASFSWDATNTILTLTYANLPDDSYKLTLFASSFQDPVGLTLVPGNFTRDFLIDATGPFALPTPVQSVSPLGSLIYTTSDTGVVLPAGDHDTFTVNLNAGQLLTIDATTGNTFDAHILVRDPNNHIIAHGDGSVPGAEVLMQTIPIGMEGTYQIVVSGLNNTLGYYSLHFTLNAALQASLHGGPSNNTQGSAQNLDNTFLNLGSNGEQQANVIGETPQQVNADPFGYQPLAVAPSFTDISSTGTAILQFTDDTGQYVPFSSLNDPVTGNPFSFSFYGQTYSAASDGNHNHMYINTDGWLTFQYNESYYFTGGNLASYPVSAAIAPFWNDLVFIGSSGAVYYQVINPSGNDPQLVIEWKNAQAFYVPGTGYTFEVVLDQNTGHLFFNYQNLAYGASEDNGALAGVGIKDFGFATANHLTVSFQSGPNQFIGSNKSTEIGVGIAPPVGSWFAFDASAGETFTASVAGGGKLQLDLYDSSGTHLATSASGFANLSAQIANFRVAADETYYINVSGAGFTPFNLVVTRNAAFDAEKNDSTGQAQDVTPTIPFNGGGAAIGSLSSTAIALGLSFDGIDFNGSNCGCLPPDTNAAVGGNYVVETTNFEIRIFNKTTSNVLLDEPLSTFYGQTFGSDPYVVYDDTANRWYVAGIDGGLVGFLLAVSNDASPLDGFTTYHLTDRIGGFVPDYPKLGFNKDAVFITYNNFGNGTAAATVVAIDKGALLSGTLTYFVSTPPRFQFRAMPPAQMHGDTTGGVEWFVSTDGTDTGGNTIRVTELTNYLSNNPVYTLTSLPVAQYQSASRADQPGGGSITTFPNTTTYQVQYRNGHLVTAMASSLAGDGFVFPKGLYYQIDVSSGTPMLLQQGVIDPGAGVAVQMPSVAEDINGNLGFTWFESSSSEFMSMWVGVLKQGQLSSAVVAPGGGPLVVSFRMGDYSTTVLDPSDGTTFWSANEYVGSDGSTDIWKTHITSFSVAPPLDSDYYSVNANAGDTLSLSVSPALDGGGEPGSLQADPTMNLYDPSGNLLMSSESDPDNGGGNTETLTYSVTTAGTYYIEVTQEKDATEPNAGQGDYVLDVSGATGGPNPLTVTKANPADGAIIQPPTSITVDFSAGIYLPSLSASDLTITDPTTGTQTATSVTLVNDHEVTFGLPSLPTVGDRVAHTISITGVQGLTGVTLTPFQETITTDNVPPAVVGTSIQEGGVATGPDLTYTVTFSEPMNTSFTTAASFALHGNFLNTGYAVSSFSWDSTGTILTINYTNLPDDTYHLTLLSSGFQDVVGLALSGDPPWLGHPQTFNTGVDNSGNLLPDGSADSHYTIVSSPDGNNLTAYVVNSSSSDFAGGWIPNGPHSKWLSEDPNGIISGYGVYDYRTTVDLTGFDPSTAVLTGQLAEDDVLQNILVNGQSTGIHDYSNAFRAFTPYTIGSTYFHAGVNTIDFLIFEYPCCQGFRNEMSLSAVPVPVPAADQIPPATSGNGLPGGDFFVDFTLDNPGPTAFPTPTTSVNPLGSLIYQGTPADPVTVSLYSGFSTVGGGAPYSGFVATLHAPSVQFGTSTGFNWHPQGLSQFGADITGDLSVAANGTYSFALNSDDGSQLFIDGSQVVDDGNPHAPTKVSGSATLTACLHHFEILFFEAFGGQSGIDLTLPTGVSYVSDAATGVIAPAGDDADSYTINVNPNETISVLMQSASLQGQITLTDPNGMQVGTALAGAVGQDALLQPVATGTLGGTYTISVNDVSGTNTGLYHLQVFLNAAVDSAAHGGSENSTIGTAQDISGSSVALGANGADRLGVLGTYNGTDDVYSFHLNAGQSATLAAKYSAPPPLLGARTDYFAPGAFGYGGSPYRVTYADLRNNGLQDMITANTYGFDLTVRLNNGDGTFGPPTEIGYFLYYPEQVVVADVDGDGTPDLVVANFFGYYYGGNVTVFPGNGDGTFGAPIASYFTEPNTNGLALADFNGDGILDVVTADSFTNNITVAFGDGHGHFINPVTYSAGSPSGPVSVATGDFNGDGHPDIATANAYGAFYGNGNVAVFLNNGDGTFGAATPIANDADYTYGIAVGDFNHDGKLDIAHTMYYGQQVGISLGNGDGTFAHVVHYTTGSNTYPYYLAAGDVNGDGNLDVATGNSSFFGPGTSVLLGNGDGTFQAPQTVSGGLYYGYSTGVAIADLVPGSGIGNVSTSNPGNSTVSVWQTQVNQVHLQILDSNGNILADAVAGPANLDEVINNFVAPADGTYYARLTGIANVPRDYGLTVTRGATFAQEPNNTPAQAQNITLLGGALGNLELPPTLKIGTNFDGIDFNGSNCGCLPPDTNAAVGGNYVVETTNFDIRIFDKGTGAQVFDQSLPTFFGSDGGFGSDPYVVYDDIASRWYVTGIDGSLTGFVLAVSNTSNPLGTYTFYHLTNGIGGFVPDYPKMGFNKDAIFISYNNFGNGTADATVVSIDKGAALSGTLTYFVAASPEFQFRAMPPAQMHGDTTGGVEWFLSTDGTDAGGSTMRVTELTNYLSNNPTFTTTSLPVAQYQSASRADQPGAPFGVTTFPNTTTTQVEYRNGHLLTAMASATAADGFVYPKGLYYEVDVSSGTPTLLRQGVIDPGAGVAVQMPSVDEDIHGNLGFTWIESSLSEYLSMWVGSLNHDTGVFTSAVAAPGGGFFPYSFRIGDYSTTVLDPTDGTTFWSANEYIGNNGFNDIWKTYVTSFTVPPPVSHDWYEIDAAGGATINLATFTPSDQGGEFQNSLDPGLTLYDANGNPVATETTGADGRNETIQYVVPNNAGGRYFVDVFNENKTHGEYFLQSQLTGPSGVDGRVFNDLLATGTDDPNDPGLAHWVITLSDTSGNPLAATVTDANGHYFFAGLNPGTYVVTETLKSGWTQDYPAAGSYTVTVATGQEAVGNDFGDYQNVSLSGRTFNDQSGNGQDLMTDPGLAGWTIDLVNADTSALVDHTVTGSDGSYSFASEKPGHYLVEEVLQSGWLQTYPASSIYTVTATSGSSTTALDFGNFQLVTLSGEVFNDTNGNGVLGSNPGTPGWVIDLLDSSGNILQKATTDTNGNFSFSGVGPGTFTLQEEHQFGFEETTTPTTYSVTTSSGTNVGGFLFGNFQDVTISGEKFNDLNGNGVLDPGEPGLQGWVIDLVNINTNVIRQLTTDANGNFSFPFVGPGTYTLQEELQPGWVQTDPGSGYTLSPTSGTAITANFGNFQLATSSGEVYNDINGDGSKLDGDQGIAGVTVELIGPGGTLTTTTDASGNYSFTGVGPGSWTIAEVLPSGWYYTQPAAPYTYAYNPTSGSNTTGQDFGNFQFASASGEVYNDLNGDGSKSDGDLGIAGVTVELIRPNGTTETTTTDTNGNYTFTDVGPGSNTIQELIPSGWIFTQPASPYTYALTPTSGGATTSDDFGNFQLVTASGTVFNDKDDNHIQDAGDPGIANVAIQLDGVNAATTDASGNYSISGVGPGSHTVTEVIPSAYIATAPASASFAFTALSGGNQTDNFANALPTETLDDGQSGFATHGANWHTLSQGWLGNSQIHTATSNTSINASWNLHHPSIPSGTYEVFVTYVPGASRTTVKYQVYDGGTLRETVTVDQTQTPTDGTYQGVVWKSLGKVQITHGRLFVRMIGTVTDATKTMDADGVLLIPDGPARRPGLPAPATGAAPATTVNGSAPVAATLTRSRSFVSSLAPSSGSAAGTEQSLVGILAATNQPASSQGVLPSAAASLPADNRTVAAGSNSTVPGTLMVGGRPTTYRQAVDSAFSMVHHNQAVDTAFSAPTNQWDDLVDFLAQNQGGNGKQR